MAIIDTLEALEAIYSPAPVAASTVKVSDRLTPHYRALVEASPFLALATVGPEGLDCSPRGDAHGLVTIADDRTLILPDRRGNNRIDSLRNIVRDPRVALLFLIPGSGTTFRVNGRAVISIEPGLLDSLAVEGKAPRTALIVTIEECYFQCARAVIRSGLWKAEAQVDPKSLPTAGAMLAAVTAGEVGGAAYDEAWPARAAATMW
ncbi:flavin-nucleotide-binding protein [Caulobacter sp. D4A]|uniref:pyridoxamine 5'-phosphate oxidase family protein n=1 Tax=unclassified Caulobacter TaxID=2648921 RepID=UPI000D73BE4F|nr:MULTISPECIES: pyridoxamine 5'-phosphate oxidase family protein [unclassified Caulobacter]PXA78937.1 flavin-nucleotide-binding protein [Caulobacter sp. D4A]PXA95959.1 flavin-nucleotide-binding protein [Caulobacter sp. D5]